MSTSGDGEPRIVGNTSEVDPREVGGFNTDSLGVGENTAAIHGRVDQLEFDYDALSGKVEELSEKQQQTSEKIEYLIYYLKRQEQRENNGVQRQLFKTLHAPLTLGVTVTFALITVALLLNGSIFGAVTGVASAFAFVTFNKIISSYNIPLMDVL